MRRCLPQVAVDVQTRREVLAGGLERMADGDEAVSTLQYPGRIRGGCISKVILHMRLFLRAHRRMYI